MPFHGKKKYIKYLKYLHAVTQSIILVCKFGHITWACLWMYKGSVSGWGKSNGSNKRQSPRVRGEKCASQWVARYASKGSWQSVPTFYSTFKTQNSHHYTSQKPLTGSTPIFGPGLISSLVMAETNGYISADPLFAGSVLLSKQKAPVSQEILLPS